MNCIPAAQLREEGSNKGSNVATGDGHFFPKQEMEERNGGNADYECVPCKVSGVPCHA